jgi:hypothetical protein
MPTISPEQLQYIRSAQVEALPDRCILLRRSSTSGTMGGSGTISYATYGTVPCRLRPMFGQAAEAEIADRVSGRDNWFCSVPSTVEGIGLNDRVEVINPDGPNQLFEVKTIDDAKGAWDTVRRLMVQRTYGGGGF